MDYNKNADNMTHVTANNEASAMDQDQDHLDATLWAIAEEESDHLFEGDDDALDALFERTVFRVNSGERTLYKEADGTWLVWDTEEMAWS